MITNSPRNAPAPAGDAWRRGSLLPRTGRVATVRRVVFVSRPRQHSVSCLQARSEIADGLTIAGGYCRECHSPPSTEASSEEVRKRHCHGFGLAVVPIAKGTKRISYAGEIVQRG